MYMCIYITYYISQSVIWQNFHKQANVSRARGECNLSLRVNYLAMLYITSKECNNWFMLDIFTAVVCTRVL